MKRRAAGYKSIGRFNIDEVLPFVVFPATVMNLKNAGVSPKDEEWKKTCEKEYNGHMVKMTSMRYVVFAVKGTVCVNCGLKGSFFSLEKGKNDKSNNRYHFNLYGVDEKGREVLMTRDHIVPKAKGGSNKLGNLQPMCVVCNGKKADLIYLSRLD